VVVLRILRPLTRRAAPVLDAPPDHRHRPTALDLRCRGLLPGQRPAEQRTTPSVRPPRRRWRRGGRRALSICRTSPRRRWQASVARSTTRSGAPRLAPAPHPAGRGRALVERQSRAEALRPLAFQPAPSRKDLLRPRGCRKHGTRRALAWRNASEKPLGECLREMTEVTRVIRATSRRAKPAEGDRPSSDRAADSARLRAPRTGTRSESATARLATVRRGE
jgi:hypothetical protein